MKPSNYQRNIMKESRLSTAVNNTLYWGKRVVLGFTLIAMVTTQAGAESFLKKTMNDYLSQTTMSNVTSAKAFKTATRGVVSGGSVQVRNKIFNDKLINFVPPSFNASCNGLDMFLGSFSFINADELVQMFRAIASNALGFLFQLALATVSEKISQLMQKFADVVRAINNMVSDSCQMAQGLVMTAKGDYSYFNKLSTSTAALGGAVHDLGDSFQSFFKSGESGSSTNSPRATQSQHFQEEAKDNGEIGNFMWNAMKRNVSRGINRSLFSRLANVSGVSEEDMEQVVMSLTGYYIAGPSKTGATAGAHSSTMDTYEEQSRRQGILDIRALIEGSDNTEYKIFKCDDTESCLKPEPKSQQDVDGLAQLMYKSLCGTKDLKSPCTNSALLTKLGTNNNGAEGTLSDEEISALFSLPSHYRSLLTDLQILTTGATKSEPTVSSAGTLIQRHIKFLALNAAVTMVDEIYRAMDEQIAGYTGSSKEMLTEVIKESKNEFYQKVDRLKHDANYGTLETVLQDLTNSVNAYVNIPTAEASPTNNKIGSSSKGQL